MEVKVLISYEIVEIKELKNALSIARRCMREYTKGTKLDTHIEVAKAHNLLKKFSEEL